MVAAKQAVIQALMEYIQRRKQLQVLALFGTVDYAEGFDTKAQRNLSRAPLAAEQQDCIHALGELVADGRAVLIGPIRQELLSGVKTVSQFEALRASLTAFDDLALSIFTLDLDFVRYQAHLAIRLYAASGQA